MPPLANLLRAIRHPFGEQPEAPADTLCPVCRSVCKPLASVDFNKNCEEARGLKLPHSGEAIEYCLCDACGFCFAPEFAAWTFQDFERRIYNADYEKVDPDYKQARPEANANLLEQLFGSSKPAHIDYGGGSGVLSAALRAKGWSSRTYDPFVDRDARVQDLGSFDLVTAFEVFEHVPDINVLFADLHSLVKADGLILFSTLLSDGEIARGRALSWWYAAPRNGHISLFSAQSLRMCLNQRGFNLASASANLHLAYRAVPAWARHLLPGA
ncbi:MAG: class I SAM-dependent methyltransferase [Burkholderiales bacterium]|nr:class I SAM-dependent methyltransferase [Burkholderiales bacterium]